MKDKGLWYAFLFLVFLASFVGFDAILKKYIIPQIEQYFIVQCLKQNDHNFVKCFDIKGE